MYTREVSNTATSSSLFVTAVDDTATNTDIVFAPKGTGTVKVTGLFTIDDGSFILEDAQGPKARFEVSNVGTGTNTRIFTLPAITSGNGTVLIGDDTQQTLRNKTILIDEDNLVLTDGTEEAIFQINWVATSNARRSYFLPDAGTVTTTAEPTATSSTLLDTKTEQTALSKTLVNLKLAKDSEVATNYAQFNTAALDANRTLTVPNLSGILAFTDATQILQNKTIESLILQDPTDTTKKITFSVANSNTFTNVTVQIPPTANLNSTGVPNTLVTETATEDLSNKTLINPVLKGSGSNVLGSVTLSIDNMTADRTIRFPDSDATLLSTENVSFDDVTFGAGISAANLTGRTRQQQFFYAGF